MQNNNMPKSNWTYYAKEYMQDTINIHFDCQEI